MSQIPAQPVEFPLVHPPLVAHNPSVEKFLEREVLRAVGTAVTILRKVLPSRRARMVLRRILLASAWRGRPSRRSADSVPQAKGVPKP